MQQALPDEISGRGSTCEPRCEFVLRQQGRKMDDEMMKGMSEKSCDAPKEQKEIVHVPSVK
ncbi:MAG: hypothetical protein WC657_08490 [Candidatus Paceibacterota bacterium]